MRLLSTLTRKLHEFFDENTPPYAILSHTWGDDEVSFQDLESNETTNKAGYSKIKSCCELAASEGWRYVWIDTCCIDKRSSSELSEAINSMFRWYQRAEVCYAYLSDVNVKGKPRSSSCIRGSRWFTRGWTLQELLAPATVIFYDRNWTEIGTKQSLQEEISSETGIQYTHLFHPMDACIAVKMSWASRRMTARREDIAYCLLGLFDLNMPLLYGEGEKAFFRLQYELLQSGDDDESIFAWEDKERQPFTMSGILAPSPAAFASSGQIEKFDTPHGYRLVSNLTRKSMLAIVSVLEDSSSSHQRLLVMIHCKRPGQNPSCLGIAIHRRSWQRHYLRADPRNLTTCEPPLNRGVFNSFRQTKRSEEILLYCPYGNSRYPSIAEQSTIGLKWPALRIDPRIAREWSKHGVFEVKNPLNSGCWTFRHAKEVDMIGMLFVSNDGECFLIVVRESSSSIRAYEIDVIISKDISVQQVLQDFRVSSYETQDTFHAILQQGSQLTVKLRKNVIDDHVYHMIHVDVIENRSVFEFKDVHVMSEIVQL